MQTVVFGEALIDLYPDGSYTLGGAPFNVAWHLCGLGVEVNFISRVGDDKYGAEFLQAMQRWGMSTAGVQIDAQHPTGQCAVIVDTTGDATFLAETNQAFDYIEADTALAQIPPDALFYHGSYIARAPTSKQTLESILGLRRLRRFFDVNLRPPYATASLARQFLPSADYLKCNNLEFQELFGERNPFISEVLERHKISTLFYTAGEQPGWLYSEKTTPQEFVPPGVEKIIDTIGAGDAFCAGVIYGLLQQWPLPLIMQNAMVLATRLCGVRGAITDDRRIYEHWTKF